MVNLFVKLGLMILKVFGWQKLLHYCWILIKPELEKASKKTTTQFDDNLIKIIDEMEQVVVGFKSNIAYLTSNREV